jgi:hypothetical protein
MTDNNGINIDLYKYLFISFEYINRIKKNIDKKEKKVNTKIYFDFNNYFIVKSGMKKKDIPIGTKYLSFEINFNEKIETGIIPDSVTHIVFPYNFNQTLEKEMFPDSVTHIKFDNYFNKPILKDVLPKNLKEIIFGNNFNCELEEGSLPNSITHLTFKSNFQHNLTKNILPLNLSHLMISPNYLGNLEIEEKDYFHLILDNLIEQSFEDDYTKFTVNYRSPVFNFNNESRINSTLNFNIPYGVTHLTLGLFFDKIIKKNKLPNSIKYLDVNSLYSIKIDTDVIPNSVIELYLRGSFSSKIEKNTIPYGVKILVFGNRFIQKITDNFIPDSVIYLQLGYTFTYDKICKYLPKNLLNLVLWGDIYDLSQFTDYTFDNNDNNKFFVGYYSAEDYILYNFNYDCIYSHFNDIIQINRNIFNFVENKIGNVIFEELTKKVFHPTRLNNLSIKYNIDFEELQDIY